MFRSIGVPERKAPPRQDLRPPAAVRRAIDSYQARPGFTVFPPSPSEKSIIHDWGVRVRHTEEGHCVWICLAEDSCRSHGQSVSSLSGGRTSRACEHLSAEHGITSEKTKAEVTQKRKREHIIHHLRSSSLYRNDPKRFNLLITTLNVVNNNLAIRSVEHPEFRVGQELVIKDSMKTTLNTKTISNAIVELYTSSKHEVKAYLVSNCGSKANLVMMADFWTCKTTSSKFLGIRVYLIDDAWRFRSVLLGTRKFNPLYGDRDHGIQGPVLAWIHSMLDDFGLTQDNFFGASSDAGADVRSMMTNILHLEWEWCTAHMLHAATKAACGMNDDTAVTPIAKLIGKVKKVINQVKTVEKVGDLFEALCKTSTEGKSVKLVDCNIMRFLSTTKSIERIIEKWPALVAWYGERVTQAIESGKAPPDFVLAADYKKLTHVLSVLKDIDVIKTMCQAEVANQVEVLASLYRLRIDILDDAKPLPAYNSTKEKPIWITVSELDEDAQQLRINLRYALDDRFFKRYYHPAKMRSASFVFEMHMRLHPQFKDPGPSLNQVIRLTGRQAAQLTPTMVQENVKTINDIIDSKLNALMTVWAEPDATEEVDETERFAQYSDELAARFAPRVHQPTERARLTNRIHQELGRWANDDAQLRRVNNVKESVLEFWKRMSNTGEYRILPKIVRVLFALPASSAQIERDFSVSGAMVTSQRASLSREKIDMCSFLSRNREFVDICQCEAIPNGQHDEYTPNAVILPLAGEESDDEDEIELD